MMVSVTMAVTVEIVEFDGMKWAEAVAAKAITAKNPFILIFGLLIGLID